ncbi:MAG: hypothetical protein GWM87_01285 [Xanthomonadales bacterium]|nr:hypothetical protein [Xanthomonadales bacterium]NIX11720.1 hypothetical protein [Xanthomonadales bacterium]
MLHQEMMFRFEEPTVTLTRSGAGLTEPDANITTPGMSWSRLVVSVFGNVLVGIVLLGGLLLAPQWLGRVLGLL